MPGPINITAKETTKAEEINELEGTPFLDAFTATD